MPPTQTGSTHPSLVRGLRRRESSAWDQMVELYRPLLEAWCRKLGVPAADGDDVVQEVLQAVARGIDQFQFRHSEPADEPTAECGSKASFRDISATGTSRTEAKSRDSSTAAPAGTFRGWLWTITRNKIHDYRRVARRQVSATGGSEAAWLLQQHAEVAEQAGDDIEPTDAVEIGGLLRRALEQVSGDFEDSTWKAFWRTTVDQLPTDVVAAELGVTPAAIRQARSRVLRRLRRQLGDQS